MVGYVIINKAEMKFKDYDVYHAFYCGLCQSLKEHYGWIGQFTLSYDMTFLVILLSGLYEPETTTQTVTCVTHPFEKHPASTNIYTDYAADMTILLSYYKCLDDWKDEGKRTSYIAARDLHKKVVELRQKYPKKCSVVADRLKKLSRLEKENEQNVDRMAGLFGEIMAEVFVCEEDCWEPSLKRIGFYLGKFVYLMDAYDDLEKDIKNDNYNPFLNRYTHTEPDVFAERAKGLLTMMMAECSREFEKLPILRYAEILRNILYSGVWCRFNDVTKRRNQENEPEKTETEMNEAFDTDTGASKHE